MLRGNLATRPFYNERLVSLLLLLVAVAAAALMTYNVQEFLRLSETRRALNERIARDEGEAARIRAETAGVRKTVDLVGLRRLSADAAEANSLIDQRTFSWTSFFGVLEAVMPYDVRLQNVAPQIERGQFIIKMGVIAKTADDLNDFKVALQKTGIFADTFSSAETITDANLIAATVQAIYEPAAPRPAPVDKPARTPRSGRGGRP